MGNTFRAHIFKRRQHGEREEVTLKLFTMAGVPLELGAPSPEPEGGDGGMIFRGAWVSGLYQAGDVVIHANATWVRETGPGSDMPGVSANVDFGRGVLPAPRLRIPQDLSIDFDTTTDLFPAYASVPGKLFFFDVAQPFSGTFAKLTGTPPTVHLLSRFKSPQGVEVDSSGPAYAPVNFTVGRWFVCLMPATSDGNEGAFTYTFTGATPANVTVPSGTWAKLP